MNPASRSLYRFSAALLAAGALFSTTQALRAQGDDLVVNTFDDETSINGIWKWWGGIDALVEWDPTQDAGGQASAGSAKFTINFDRTNADNQYAFGLSLAGQSSYNSSIVASPSEYSAIEFDVLYDTNSTVTVDQFNNSGADPGFNMGLTPSDWSQSWISPSPTLTGGGTWQHVVVPIEVTRPSFAGLIFKKWQPSNDTGLNGTVGIWIDNIKLIKSSAPPPPPTMHIEKNNARGVQLFASAGGQYQRQGLAATSEAALATWWVGNPEPVTYSLTLADAPLNPNFQVHLFLSPDSGGANSPDWNDPNVIFLDIRRNADGTGQATFRYKTNAPNNNDMMYGQNGAPNGQLAVLPTPSALGTWSLKFQNDTNITLTGPGNSVTNFAMSAESAELFRPGTSMTASFGVQPNQLELLGQSATFTEFKITSGSTTVLSDTFQPTEDPAQPVDSTLWTRRMDDQKGLVIVGADTPYVVTWGVPDDGYVLMSRGDLKTGAWTEVPVTPTLVSTTKRVLIANTNLPAATQGFFQLMKTNSPSDTPNN